MQNCLISAEEHQKEDDVRLTKEDAGKVDNALELLLQCMELFPSAKSHVEQYVSYAEVCDFKERLKDK